MRAALILGTSTLLCWSAWTTTRAAAPPPIRAEVEIAALVPPEAVVFVEAPDLGAVLAEGLEHPLVRRILESKLASGALAEAGIRPEDALGAVDTMLGRPLLPALASMTRHGAALSVLPSTGQPQWCLVARGDDEALWDEVLVRAIELALAEHDAPLSYAEPHDEIQGADVWYLGDELCLALRAASFVASNDKSVMRAALDRLVDDGAAGLSANESFVTARRERSEDDLLWAWVDLQSLEDSPGGLGDLRDLRAMAGKPEVHLLLGSAFALTGRAGTISAALAADAEGLGVRIRARDVEEHVAGALLAGSDRRSFAAPAPLRADSEELLQATLYRDLAGVFEHRAELFEASVLPGFSQAVSQLSLFLGGMDLEEDVLPSLSPWIQVVSRRVDFDAAATPEIPLPAVALRIDLDDPDVGHHLVGAFQSLISLTNVERVQKGQRPLFLKLAQRGDLQLSYAHFPTPGPEDGVDIQYNLVPACTVVGNTFVVGTHLGLVEDVVRGLSDERVDPAAGRSTAIEHLHLQASAAAELVRANFEALVANNMLEKGHSKEAARKEIGGLLLLLEELRELRVRVVPVAADEIAIELDVTFEPRRAR